jgi:hypothetical protein
MPKGGTVPKKAKAKSDQNVEWALRHITSQHDEEREKAKKRKKRRTSRSFLMRF